MRKTFRALQYRNYRFFFLGQSVSLIGTWMQSVGMSWLIYRLTGSAVLLGTVSFFSLVPAFFLSPFAGVWLDRWNKHKVIVVTQSVSLIQAALLAALTLLDVIQPWEILGLSMVMGVVIAFDTPARQAFMVDIVENREDLGNAIALNSSLFNLARLVGPAIAGIVIHQTGEGFCFALNALSFVGVIGALLLMNYTHTRKSHEKGQLMVELRAGAAYVWHFIPIRSLLALMAVMSFVSGCYNVLLPVFAKEVFGGNAQTLGLLYSAVGVGALTSAYLLASRASVYGLGRWVALSACLFGISLIGFALATRFAEGAIFLALGGLGAMAHMSSTNTMIQMMVDDKMRGRVMAWYTMSFIGTMPVGSLVSGFAAERFNAPLAVGVSGGLAIVAGIAFYRVLPRMKTIVHPIYEEKGHLRPVEISKK